MANYNRPHSREFQEQYNAVQTSIMERLIAKADEIMTLIESYNGKALNKRITNVLNDLMTTSTEPEAVNVYYVKGGETYYSHDAAHFNLFSVTRGFHHGTPDMCGYRQFCYVSTDNVKIPLFADDNNRFDYTKTKEHYETNVKERLLNEMENIKSSLDRRAEMIEEHNRIVKAMQEFNNKYTREERNGFSFDYIGQWANN